MLATTGTRTPTASGRLACVELHGERGAMPPLHVHRVDETYHVLDGEVTFYVGRDTTHARAGDVVLAPRDLPRTFRVASTHASWLVLTSVRSLARYEDFTRAAVQPNADRDWSTAEDAAAAAAIAAANGIEVLGPPRDAAPRAPSAVAAYAATGSETVSPTRA